MRRIAAFVLISCGLAFGQTAIEFKPPMPFYPPTYSNASVVFLNLRVPPQGSCTTALHQDMSGGFLYQVKDSVNAGTTADSAKWRMWAKCGLLKTPAWIIGQGDSLLYDSTATVRRGGAARLDTLRSYAVPKGSAFCVILTNDRQTATNDTLYLTLRFVIPDFNR